MVPPKDTPYQTYTHIPFECTVEKPGDYPFVPPKIRCTIQLFHPNISTRGEICLDILSAQWSPALTLERVFCSIRALFQNPNPSDPLNPEAAKVFKEDRELFDKIVGRGCYSVQDYDYYAQGYN